jgi:plastocyanin
MKRSPPTVRPARALAGSAVAAVLSLSALLPGLAHAQVASPPSVPAAVQVPPGNVRFLLGHATGTQDYACQPSSRAPAGYAWTFVAPAATLVDDNGAPILTHFAGPTWQAPDGSAAVGAREDGVTVSPSAIDWLLLRATSATPGPDGGGQLAATSYVQRVNTTGGLAPAGGCDATTIGAAAEVPYTADYYLYQPGEAAAADMGTPQQSPAGMGDVGMPPAAPAAVPAAPAAPAAPAPASAVKIAGFAFGPANLTVARGQTITWTNGDAVAHTITSDAKVWDSGPVVPGASFSVTLTEPGTYTYFCAIHPSMRGTVVVAG